MTFAALAEFLGGNDLTLEVQCTSGVWEARLRKGRSDVWVKAHDRTLLGAIVRVVKWAMA